jgi:hypothetical protein
MTLLNHLGHRTALSPAALLRRPGRAAAPPRAVVAPPDAGDQPAVDGWVYTVQRLGAVAVGLVLAVFGLLGAAGGVGFLATHGQRHLGMSSNGLLSALSLVVAAVLLGAAFRGPRTASTVMVGLGVLFLVSALLNGALLHTAFNLLAFRMSNVVFSVAVGFLLLVLGAYGRFSGNLPENSPYAHPHAFLDEPPDLPETPEELAAEAAMRDAEIAVVQHNATDEQRRRVQAMALVRTRDARRHVWMAFDSRTPVGIRPGQQHAGHRRLLLLGPRPLAQAQPRRSLGRCRGR